MENHSVLGNKSSFLTCLLLYLLSRTEAIYSKTRITREMRSQGWTWYATTVCIYINTQSRLLWELMMSLEYTQDDRRYNTDNYSVSGPHFSLFIICWFEILYVLIVKFSSNQISRHLFRYSNSVLATNIIN